MVNPIVVSEHDKKKLENCDLEKLHHYLECKQLGSALKVTPSGIETNSWVGVIKYKNFHLQILPKLICEEDYNELNSDRKENIKSCILKNLIFMLSFAKKLDIKTSNATELSKTKNPFLEILIREFANSLFGCLKRVTPKNYIREEENLNCIRGKIKFTENIHYNFANKAKFYCEYDEFSDNNILNQLFLFVSTCLYNISKDSYNKKILKFILNYYSDIKLIRFDKFKADKIKLCRNQDLFKKPFKLAKMFVENTSVDLSKNKIENITLIWDMNKLFEEFIFESLKRKEKEKETDWSFTPQKPKKLFKKPPLRKTYVDIYGELNNKEKNNDNKKIIIDTKYKKILTSKDFSNADVYQVVTYCLIHNTNSALLLYPRWGKEEPDIPKENYLNSDGNNINIIFKTINLKYQNLSKHISDIQDEIIKVLNIEILKEN